jgi:uncharacterized protein (TIGR03067 family)
MARTCSLLYFLFLATALAPAAPGLKERPAKMPPIFGEWLRVGHTEAGKPLMTDGEDHHQMFTDDGQWNYSYRGGKDTSGGSFVLDLSQNPPTFDISMGGFGSSQYRGIYKIEGDTLTLCLVSGDLERPKTFESTAEKPTTIWVFKRVRRD